MRRILPTILALITRRDRYFPVLEWSKDSWVHNAFRAYEQIFGRAYGKGGIGDTIRLESTAWTNGAEETIVFHSLESILVHIEHKIRGLVPKRIPIRIYIPILQTPQGIPMFASPYLFAIAYVTSAVANLTAGNSASTTMTASGSDRLLVSYSWSTVSNTVTATYDGVSMGTAQTTTTRADNGIYNHLFVLVNPNTTASATMSFTTTGTSHTGGFVACYSGCNQTGQPDGTNGVLTQANGTSATSNITVTASNCWVVGGYVNDNTAANTVTGSGAFVSRRQGTMGALFTGVGFFDSNGTVSTGSIAYGGAGANGGQTLTAISIAPVSAAGPANLKSYDGNVKANIKSIAGNVIANVKSLSGNS